MRYLSDITNEVYDSIQELEEAETAYLEKEAEKEKAEQVREERRKEVENAFNEAEAARRYANELLEKYCRDYGSFYSGKNLILKKTEIDNMIENTFAKLFGR